MPRNPKFTKEEVLVSAFEVAGKQGLESVTAASVAKNMGYTGSSLFTHFESMEEIRHEVFLMAKKRALDFFSGCTDYFPALKEFGMRWIRFAKEEPNLYRMLFAGNPFSRTENVLTEFKDILKPIQDEAQRDFRLSEAEAEKLISGSITQANGIALAIITGHGESYTEDRLCEELSGICIGMVLLFKAKNGTLTMDVAERLAAATGKMPVKKQGENQQDGWGS